MFVRVQCQPNGLAVATSYDGNQWLTSSTVIPYQQRTRRRFFIWPEIYIDPRRDRDEYLHRLQNVRKVAGKENQSNPCLV